MNSNSNILFTSFGGMDSAWEVFHESCCGCGCISVEVITDGTDVVATAPVSLNVGIPAMADGSGRTPSAAEERVKKRRGEGVRQG